LKISLPTESQLSVNAGDAGESHTHFWKVDDMWKFDNLGFTKAIPGADGQPRNFKFVVCGVCDKGILGLQYIGTGDNNIYVAPNRVVYQ
jgi:hypothetical protein